MRSLITLLWWMIAAPLTALWGFPWTLLTGKIDAMYWAALWVARVGVRIAGVRWKLIGLEQLPMTSNYIFMSNHVSNVDPPLLIPLLPRRVTVMVKKELFKLPILGRAMRMADFVPIDRTNRDAAIGSVREAATIVRKGLDLVVFPEGTRSSDGRLLPFKKGSFYLAMDTGVPIVPVTILGTEELLPKGSVLARPGKVSIVFHSPIDPKEFNDRDELVEAVRKSVASALPGARR
jgi:1-acyl-sn-glycerol-3-phosphate acyltransferase